MSSTQALRAALLVLLCVAGLSAESLKVMSFNVRYPAKGDGPDVWESRRDLLVATIQEKSPDVFGTQELFYEQGQYIVEKAPEYAWFGVSRQGDKTDEHMSVFYKSGVLRLLESGNFWLSENPETAARVECAKVIHERIARLPKDALFVLTGDFNTDVGSAPYKVTAEGLIDAWETAETKRGPRGTFHGFKGTPGQAQIDWIFFRGFARATQGETITKNEGGRYPSDHFPVFAALEF